MEGSGDTIEGSIDYFCDNDGINLTSDNIISNGGRYST